MKLSKTLILISVMFFGLSSAQAEDEEELVQMIQVCNTSQSAFHSYRTMVSVPPIIGGELGRTTFAEICDLLLKIYTLNAKVKDLATKLDTSNKTERNWQTDLLLGVTIANVAASRYYGNAEPNQPAEIEDQEEDRAMRDFYREIGNDERISQSRFRNDREQVQSMDGFNRAARQRSMLSEALVCPNNDNNPDYRQIYQQQLQPLTIERRRYELKRNHYFMRLKEIGPTFLKDDAHAKYRTQLDQLHKVGVIIKVINEEKKAPYFTKKDPLKAGEDARIVKSNSAVIKTQKFYSDVNAAQFATFKADWRKRWKDYVDKYSDRIDRSFDIADNCLGSKPANTDIFNADQVNAYADYQRRCNRATNEKDKTPAAFMFEEALTRYQQNAEKFAALQAQIWTKESSLLKRKIIYNNIVDGAVELDLKPNCDAEPMSNAKLKETKLKLLETENEYKEIVARERIKDGMLRDEELRQQNELAEKQRMQQTLIEKQQRQQKEASGQNGMTSPNLGGAF